MTTYADQGCSHCCSRSLGETVAAAASDVSLTRAAEGLSISARPKTDSSRVRTVAGEELGTSSPTSTPARVGCTPEAKVAAQRAMPSTTYGVSRQTPSQRNSGNSDSSSAATRSGPGRTSPV